MGVLRSRPEMLQFKMSTKPTAVPSDGPEVRRASGRGRDRIAIRVGAAEN